MLEAMHVSYDEEDEKDYLVLEFTEGKICLECPIGESPQEVFSLLGKFAVAGHSIVTDDSSHPNLMNLDKNSLH